MMYVYIAVVIAVIIVIVTYLRKRKKVSAVPAGIMVWDASGRETLDMSHNVCHLLGSFTVSANDSPGSRTISLSSGYRLFCYCISDNNNDLTGIAINGNTINYIPSFLVTGNSGVTVFYGEY